MENENNKKTLFPVNSDSIYSVIIFIISLILIVGITFLIWAIRMLDTYAARLCVNLLIIVAFTAVAVTAMFLTGQQKKLLPSKNKLWLQF